MKKGWMVSVAIGMMLLGVGGASAWEERMTVRDSDGTMHRYTVRERGSFDGMKTYMTIRDQDTGEEIQGTRRYGIVRNSLELRNTRTGETMEIDLGRDPDFFTFTPRD